MREAIGTRVWFEKHPTGRLSAAQKGGLVAGMIRSQLAGSASAVGGALGLRRGGPVDLDAVVVPDSRLVQEVAAFVVEALPAPLVVHSHRTHLLASMLAQEARRSVDPELLLVASLLHDIGLGSRYRTAVAAGDFTAIGGRDAERLLLRAGWSAERAVEVFNAIGLHVNPTVDPDRHGVEAHALARATAMETVGSHRRRIPAATLSRVLYLYPRDGFSDTFIAALTSPHGPGTRADTMARLGAARLVRRNPLDHTAVRA